MTKDLKSLPLQPLADICRRWKVDRLWAFGSILTGLGPESDIDLLVQYLPDADVGILERLDMQDELSSLLGREVDLVPRAGLENPFLRATILDSCVEVYAA